MATGDPGKPSREDRLNSVYLAIIARYKEYIEEKEGLSVAELPTLVTPENAMVKRKVDEIKSGFLNYSYEANFADAGSRAYEFVKKDIDEMTLPLQFWLSPDETLEFMLGDAMDKNILLCSMLIGLGNPSSRVLVKMEENSRKVYTYYEFKDRVHLLDMENGTKEFESKDALLKRLGTGDDVVVYEFNNHMYADIY